MTIIVKFSQQRTWLWQQCVPFIRIKMLCLAVNACYFVVKNVQLLSYPVKNRMGMKQTRVLKFVFIYAQYYHTLIYIPDFHTKKKEYFHCVPKFHKKYKHKIIHKVRYFVTGDIHYRISWEVLHSIYSKTIFSFATCVHTRYPSLCQRTQ